MSVRSIFFLLLIFFLPLKPGAQSISKKEISQLFSIIEKKLESKSNNRRTEAASEFFFLVLNTDSVGKINFLHKYADMEIRDSSFIGINELSVSDFKGWVAKKAKNKVIIVPVLSSAPGDGDNIHQIFSDVLLSKQRKKLVLTEKNRTIITKVLVYTVPTRII